MARFLSRCLGRARSIASRTGSTQHPAEATAGTWKARGRVVAYAESKTDESRLQLSVETLTDNGGRFDGGLRADCETVLLDLSEGEAISLASLGAGDAVMLRKRIAEAVGMALALNRKEVA